MHVLILRMPGLHREAQEPLSVAKNFTDKCIILFVLEQWPFNVIESDRYYRLIMDTN